MKTLVSSRALRTGEQGVLLVLSELVRRGFMPYRPVVDDHGVDIMLYSGVHIQVKSANLSTHRNFRAQQVYQFTCSQRTYGPGARNRAAKWNRIVFGNACDYLILVGIDERRFWIIPAEVADAQGKTGFVLGPKPMPSAAEVYALRQQGKSYEDIATILDCGIATVWDREKRGDLKGKTVRKIRSYENRWDLLEQLVPERERISLPTVYERDEGFVGTLAGPIPVAA